MKYNSLLFGNGLTLNLLYQLKPYIPENKRYLLSIDLFLKEWIKGGISPREENKLYTAFYGNRKDMQQKFKLIKDNLNVFFQNYSSDLEYFLGATLFEKTEDDLLKSVKMVFPLFYNAWWIILAEYLEYQNLNNRINNFYQQVAEIITKPGYIYTTNFDLFADSLHSEHLHGCFLPNIKGYNDIIFHSYNDEEFYYKYVWGHNGIGKLNLIEKLRVYPDCPSYFNFNFFFDSDLKMDNMLIYGMGFKKSGYINQLQELQESGKLNQVDVTYYDESEKEYLRNVLDACMVPNYRLISCQNFDFHI